MLTHLPNIMTTPPASSTAPPPPVPLDSPIRSPRTSQKVLTDYEKILTYLHERAEVLTMELRDTKADSPAQRAKVQEKRSEIENLLACISEASHELHKEKGRLSAKWKSGSPRESTDVPATQDIPESEQLKATTAHMTQTLEKARTDMQVLKTLMRFDKDEVPDRQKDADAPDQRMRIISAMLDSASKQVGGTGGK